MFYLIIILFVLGYAAITLEYKLAIDKAAIALITGALIWVCIAFGGNAIYPGVPAFQEYVQAHPGASVMDFVTRSELVRYLGKISELLFFVFGSMTIVELIDSHGGFSLLSKTIKTTNRVKLLWTISFLTFLASAVLGNLPTTIIMIALMWKLIGGKITRWYFASMIVIAASAGGAWSPIGGITTIMLWTGGHITPGNIVLQLFVPSLICMLVPLITISLTMKGETVPPSCVDPAKSLVPTTDRERLQVLLSGIAGLLFVPVFSSITHLPPYVGMLLVLGMMWIMIEFLHRKKQKDLKMRLTLGGILKKTDTPTIFFLLGILLAMAGLESAGHLNLIGSFLDEKVHHPYIINLGIGMLSSVLDNVPLVAGAMGMYDKVPADALVNITDPGKVAYMKNFVTNGAFWEFLAYCAGTGGNILLIGSTAGVTAMGMSKIEFTWYIKKISLLALAGYLTGAAAYYLIVI